jgi:inorganic triphosphatase YgiF
MVLPRTPDSLQALLEGKLLADSDAQVRLATLLAMAEMSASEEAGAAVFAMLSETRNSEDRWIPDAATCAAARHDAGFLKSVLGQFKPAATAAQTSSDSKPTATARQCQPHSQPVLRTDDR